MQVLPVLNLDGKWETQSEEKQVGEHWRMRQLLGKKLSALSFLFEPQQVFESLWPLLQSLWKDHVAEVIAADPEILGVQQCYSRPLR